jgi:hypothetical protein
MSGLITPHGLLPMLGTAMLLVALLNKTWTVKILVNLTASALGVTVL